MPRDGAITFGDLVGKLDMLYVACDKCGRKGRYALARLIEQRGRCFSSIKKGILVTRPTLECRLNGAELKMRILITAIAVTFLTVPAHAQGARMGTGKRQQQDTQKPEGGSTPPRNTIPCEAFTKNERGNWYVKGPVTFDIGTAENKTLQNMEIPPKFFTIGGASGVRTLAAWCLGRGGNHHRVLDVGDYLGGCPRTETFSPRLSLRRGGHSNTPTKNLPLETGGHLLS